MNKKKQPPQTPPEENKPQEKKKMSRFGKLYIAAAICTACVCLIVLGITTQISRSVLRWEEESTVSIPSVAPVDSLIPDSFALPSAAPAATPAFSPLPEKTPAPTAAPAQESPDADSSESVEAGLFKKDERIKLAMPLSGEILNECSLDRLKKSKTLGDWRTHNGVDIKADMATAVNAAAGGTVVRSEYDNSMGYVVVIEHDNQYKTLYANLASNEMVETGQKINAGECLGAVGDSAVFEKLEESHLHFELIKNGQYLNPMEYMGQ